jgi:hypothetical protein
MGLYWSIKLLPGVPRIVTLILKNIEPIIYQCFFRLFEPLNSPKFKARAHLPVFVCVSRPAYFTLPACKCVSRHGFFTSEGPQSLTHSVLLELLKNVVFFGIPYVAIRYLWLKIVELS